MYQDSMQSISLTCPEMTSILRIRISPFPFFRYWTQPTPAQKTNTTQTWDWEKVKKEENDAGVKALGRGLGATPPEAEGFFSLSSQKTAFWSMKIRYLQVSELYV